MAKKLSGESVRQLTECDLDCNSIGYLSPLAPSDDDLCNEIVHTEPASTWRCGREKNHKGKHAAYLAPRMIAVWGQKKRDEEVA